MNKFNQNTAVFPATSVNLLEFRIWACTSIR